MTRSRLHRIALAAALAGAAAAPGTAGAASFQILEQSPALLGNAFAGTASQAADATTVFFNPAGMAMLDGPRYAAGANLIMPVADFDDQGSTRSDGATPQSGPDGKTDETGFVPNFYYVRPLNDRWIFGFGVSAPFGLATSYDPDWVGRYHATDSDLAVVNVNPTLAYRVDERLSLGVGLSYQRIDATLENEVDSFAACVSTPAGNPGDCSGVTFGTPLAPSQRSQDSSASIEADDYGFGLDLSLLYRVNERTRIGVLWRQGVEFTLEGDADFDKSTDCASNLACDGALTALEGDIEADVELPDTLNLSVSHVLDERWTLHGDIAWTDWSSLQEVRIVKPSDGTEVSTLELEYDDTMRYALGATFHDGGPWTWRGGVAFDEAPQTDPEFQTPRVPDEDRTWLAFGFNYASSPTSSIDFGYAHLFVDDADVNNTEQGNTLTGEFDPSVDIVAVQANWRF